MSVSRVFLAAGLLWFSGVQAAPVVNEFVARPAGEEGEWIEILNPGEAEVSLNGWTLRDGTGNRRTIRDAVSIPPGGLVILASRPESLAAHVPLPPGVFPVRPDGWPVLNDHDASKGAPADVIVLADPQGVTADSVAYFEAWLPPVPGRSLERSRPDASGVLASSWGWSTDVAGATPGRPNSLALAGKAVLEEGSWQGPESVAPGRVPAVFTYRWPGPGTLVIALLDPEGRRVLLLQNARAAAAVGTWIWSAGLPLPPRPGDFYLCMRWEGETGRLLRVCRRIWVTR